VRPLELDSRLRENFSWRLILCVGGLVLFGLVNLFSVSGGELEAGSPFVRQAAFAVVGCFALVGVLAFDYRYLRQLIWPLMVVSLIALVLVPRFGVKVNGATRWLDFGGFRWQPSEMAKFASMIALASWLSRKECKDGLGFKDLLVPFLIVLIPCVLVAKQPDVGTALHIFLASQALIIYRRPKPAVIITALLLAVAAGTWLFALDGLEWLVKKEVIRRYHISRYDTFLAPEKDPNGKGWQIIQSKNAIGSGQIKGRGFMEGSQQKYGFLPAAETDFAFAALSEEWGFLGAIALLGLLLLLLLTMLAASDRAGDKFGAMTALGMASVIFWGAFINVAMCMGLFPVVGIPLPFISYGGTSLVVSMMAVGLTLNVGMRRYHFLDKPIQATSNVVWAEAQPVPVDAAAPRIRRLAPYDPNEPEHHPAYRMPHSRPWLKHLIKKPWVEEF
jgi:rod shape determining protein RodA